MSEIEKLYENAGIKKLLYCDICKAQEHALGLCAETKCEPFYPPFTAEKTVTLLDFISKKYSNIQIIRNLKDEYRIEAAFYRQNNTATLAEAIADFLNEKMSFYQDYEKEQIRSILKG